jgi:pimeloyl-ACP methyl ester carboxylesterase
LIQPWSDQYADVGHGIPVLAIHGASGGFDQGLYTTRIAFGNDMEDHYRIIAPSRFGYLATPMPSDGNATPAAQADAHAALLDALGIHDKVVTIGFSAGGLSSMQFAIKHPDRVAALILESTDSWKPSQLAGEEEQGFVANDLVMNTVLRSDFAMWTLTKVAREQMISILGVPSELQKAMTAPEQREMNEIMMIVLPVSERHAGIVSDGINHYKLERYALESIHVPTLIVDAKVVSTYLSSKYTAEHIPDAKLVAFVSGGHLLVGHGEDNRAAIKDSLIQQHSIESDLIDLH